MKPRARRGRNAPGERLARAEEIFFRAAALPEAERARAVARLCADDKELAADVEQLLDHAERVGDFLERPALGTDFVLLPAQARADTGDDGERDEMVGCTVGRYRIEKRIASGGMGTVYLAARADEQFVQQVALKIVKRGMDTDEILARFRRERQTLAALEHPNIARLIDGGTTATGQSYLVMEFVHGEPIDVYCDRRRLDIEARLELFLAVCEAVRFAHQNLVVHRDLKPGNVLVTSAGVPKLLDFGIAKVLDAENPRNATAVRDRRLTPEYASPEQVAGEQVATTSDVYSLGVLLYELLAGQRPYDFTTRTPADIQRVVADTEPQAPSVKARHAADPDVRSTAASARRSSPEQLARRLRGDLDTIVLAALRKDPRRRYPSVENLAADVRRHLDRQPVSAHRDTWVYRAGKFVRRHTVATTLGILSILLLVVGGAGFAWQARSAGRERDAAMLARAQSEAVNAFLRNMLASVGPSRMGRNVTMQEVLDEAARHLDSELGDQPLVQASLHKTIGATYFSLGLYDQAESHLRSAHQQRLALLGPRSEAVAESMVDLAIVLDRKHALDEAATLLEGSLAIARALHGPETASMARTLSSLGSVRCAQGRLDEAEQLQREALELRRRETGADSLDVAESLNNLAAVLGAQRRFDEAQPLFEAALRFRREQLGEQDPLVTAGMNNLAMLLHAKGDFDAAEPLYRTAIEFEARTLGEDHPDVLATRSSLALLLVKKGRLVEAEEQLRQCLAARERLLPASDAQSVTTRCDLAEVLLMQGEDEEADALVDAALAATDALRADAPERRLAVSRAAGYFDRRGQSERAAGIRAQQPVR